MDIRSLIASALQAAGSIGGGMLAANGAGKETKMQKTQRNLVDSLLSSLQGNGPYGDLFNSDEEAFNKSIVQPAQQRFSNQIAPQIQQQYIASGQQRGTGLDDQLLRAGIDMNSLIDQQMLQFHQGAQNRKQSAINSILGSGKGAQNESTTGQNLSQATAGYLSSDAFTDAISQFAPKKTKTPQQQPNPSIFQPPPRKGFESDYMNWGLGDSRWGQQ